MDQILHQLSAGTPRIRLGIRQPRLCRRELAENNSPPAKAGFDESPVQALGRRPVLALDLPAQHVSARHQGRSTRARS